MALPYWNAESLSQRDGVFYVLGCDGPFLSPMGGILAAGVIGAGGKVYFLPAIFTRVFVVEFIGEYLNLGPATLAFADERFQVSKGFKTGTVATGRVHYRHLLIVGGLWLF